MEFDIATIGGYEAVGRQMTAVRAGDDVVVFDMGLSQGPIHDTVEAARTHSLDLIDAGAIPARQEMADVSRYVGLAESEGVEMGRHLPVSRTSNRIQLVG